MTEFRSTLCISALAVLLAPVLAMADVRMDFEMSVEAGGDWAALSSEGTTTTWISGDKSRSESHMESNSALLGAFAQNLDTVSITVLSEEIVRHLMPEKEQYSETTFPEMRARMEQTRERVASMDDSGRSLPVDEDDCQWSEPRKNREKTGEKQRFANVKAEREIISLYQTCTVPDTGQVCEMSWIMDRWMARRMPGDDEARAYSEEFERRLGMDELANSLGGNSAALMGMFGSGWDGISEETEGDKRYPVHLILQLEMGGEACTTASGQNIGDDDVWGNAADAGVRAGAYSAGYWARSSARYGAYRAAGGGVSGSIASSVAGAAASEAVSGIIKGWGKKSKKKAEEQKQEEAAPPPEEGAEAQMAVLVRLVYTLIGVDTSRHDPSIYRVPAGWELVAGYPY